MAVRILRWTGLGLLGVLALALITILTLLLLGTQKLSRTHAQEGKPITVTVDAQTLTRGEHLVRAVSGCADCHGQNLSGTRFMDEPGFATIYAPNLTSGQGGAASAYSETDWERAVRQGIAKSGRALAPMMPSEAGQNFSDSDLAAIVAYIRSVPPIDNVTPEPQYGVLAKVLTGAGVFPLAPDLVAQTERLEPVPEIAVSAEYGDYLARIAGCSTCHGANLTGGTHPAHPDVQTPNLLARMWSPTEFERALRTGQTPDGDIDPELMPWPLYANMTDDELSALRLHLEARAAAQ